MDAIKKECDKFVCVDPQILKTLEEIQNLHDGMWHKTEKCDKRISDFKRIFEEKLEELYIPA